MVGVSWRVVGFLLGIFSFVFSFGYPDAAI